MSDICLVIKIKVLSLHTINFYTLKLICFEL